jgi:hypothetical protein
MISIHTWLTHRNCPSPISLLLPTTLHQDLRGSSLSPFKLGLKTSMSLALYFNVLSLNKLQVGAIRVLCVDEQEALLQSHGIGIYRSVKANGSSRLSCISANLDEEVFLAQLALRAKLLNDEFQEKIMSIVASHCISAVERNQSVSLAPDTSTVRIVGFLCDFGDHFGRVEVHCAKPKAVSRMREKLHKYVNPHPRSEWPLCANILDPVRASIVCSGASQILKILSWFTEQQDPAGLPICRMKNKFSFPADLVPDGYRDLQMCVLFQGSSRLSIIGEIQIHDAELHDLKLKVSPKFPDHTSQCKLDANIAKL